jgi:hypothetical protein
MAAYHLTVKPVSRGAGRYATAVSAYRGASIVYDRTRALENTSPGSV